MSQKDLTKGGVRASGISFDVKDWSPQRRICMLMSMCDDLEETHCSMTNRMKAARGCLLAASVIEGPSIPILS